MIRAYEHSNPSVYKDFENYVFTNLDSKYVDISNDKVTLESVDYRISTLKDLDEVTPGSSIDYIRDAWSTRFSEDVDVATVEEALDDIYEFTSVGPDITISPAPAAVLRERGNDIVNPQITGRATLGQNPQGTLTLMEFFRGTVAGTLFASEVNPTPATNYQKQDTFTVDNNQTYTVRITDSEARQDTAATTYTFTYPYYTGWVDEQSDIFDGMTRANILALAGMNLLVETQGNKTVVSSPVNGRFCIIYPASYGALSEIIDDIGFDTITDYDTFTYDVVGLDGTTQSYRVYILKNDTTQTDFSNSFNY